MFAAQAALVIANAGAHREEQRARSDLETLVNTSPVGVVVFDGRTGEMASVNREALRIVDGLRDADRPAEDLLEVVTCVRSDGREYSLRDFTLVELLNAGETVRAEEIALRVPDGRSVSVLVNATPIRSGDGQLQSFVVTLQDLTPLEEQERLRADFLGMVSHELRAPLASIKGSAATVLGGGGGFGPAEMVQFFHIIDQQADQMSGLVSDLLDVARIETGALSVTPEPVLLAALVEQARSAFAGRGRPARRPHRPAAGPAPGNGRPPAHSPGAGQPAGQRRPLLAGCLAHPGERGGGGVPGGGDRGRPGQRGVRRGAAAAVPQVLPGGERGAGR